jgi:hypothetical protein
MNIVTRSRKFNAKSSARLGAYLATGIGASTVAISNSDAAVVNINIGSSGFNIDGINAGLSSSTRVNVFNFPANGGGGVYVWNFDVWNSSRTVGLSGYAGLQFAINGGATSPRNFAVNSSIDSSASFMADSYYTSFSINYSGTPYNSPNFGPGSYMGFKTATNNYGWLEVTWDSKTSQFQILSGAYESTPGTAILAGATAPIPEASSSLLALVAGGAALTRRRRQRAA